MVTLYYVLIKDSNGIVTYKARSLRYAMHLMRKYRDLGCSVSLADIVIDFGEEFL